jgi:hypothetical protein
MNSIWHHNKHLREKQIPPQAYLVEMEKFAEDLSGTRIRKNKSPKIFSLKTLTGSDTEL